MTEAMHNYNDPETSVPMREVAFEVLEGEHLEEQAFDPAKLLEDVVDDKIRQFEILQAWPMYQPFEFSTLNIVGNGVIDANSGGRFRSALKTIEQAAPEASNRPMEERPDDVLKTVHRYLTQPVKIEGNQVARHVLLPTEQVVDRLLQIWEATNHPMHQALSQLQSEFGQKLSEKQFDELQTCLVLTSQQTLIVNIYKDYIAAFKRLATHTQANQ